MSDLPSNWGITTPDRLLSNLRVAETGGDVAECADALEWMLRSGRLVDRETIDYEAAYKLPIPPEFGATPHAVDGGDWMIFIQKIIVAAIDDWLDDEPARPHPPTP